MTETVGPYRTMKISAKTLYRELHSSLGDSMQAAGCKITRDNRLGWTRPAASGSLSVWFQADKWGWDADWGSKFTVEFGLVSEAQSWANPTNHRCQRIGYLLEGYQELDELRILNNQIIESLPGTRNGRLVVKRFADGTEFVTEGVRADPEEAVEGRDIWLSYYSTEDVRVWGTYFRKHLLEFIDRFEREQRSQLGEARKIFDHVLAKVQATASVEEKIELLERFATETDPRSRQWATNWLQELYARLKIEPPSS